jgi:hypothetical protein
MSRFQDIAEVASMGDRALDGVYDGVFDRADCKIVFAEPEIGLDELVARDDLLSFGMYGNA